MISVFVSLSNNDRNFGWHWSYKSFGWHSRNKGLSFYLQITNDECNNKGHFIIIITSTINFIIILYIVYEFTRISPSDLSKITLQVYNESSLQVWNK